MRTFLFITTLFAMFIFAIVAGYKPAMIEKEYQRIKAPVENYFAQQQEAIWRDAKNSEWQAWLNKMHVSADCSNRQTALQQVECNSERQVQLKAFEREWANKVAQGWKPKGID